jgi:hypothetical protein
MRQPAYRWRGLPPVPRPAARPALTAGNDCLAMQAIEGQPKALIPALN